MSSWFRDYNISYVSLHHFLLLVRVFLLVEAEVKVDFRVAIWSAILHRMPVERSVLKRRMPVVLWMYVLWKDRSGQQAENQPLV